MLGGVQAEINRGQYFAGLGAYAAPGSAMDHTFIKYNRYEKINWSLMGNCL